MNKFFKSAIALAVLSATSVTCATAAVYEVQDMGEVTNIKYTAANQFNANNEMAIAGSGIFNLPIQYEYLDEDDFDTIVATAKSSHELVFGINDIEDEAALRAGDPTANDLFWVQSFLATKSSDFEYQKLSDTVAIADVGSGSEELVIWDQAFEGTSTLTRSTDNMLNGITNGGWLYGAGSAPYLAVPFTKDDGVETTYFVRDFSLRGFFSKDSGTTILPLLAPTESEQPEERRFGGESNIYNMSENSSFAVGYASTSLNETILERIEGTEDGDCKNEEFLKTAPFEVCLQAFMSSLYNLEAGKWTINSDNGYIFEKLGQLITPHEEDTRSYSSQAFAVNDYGVAVGRAHGWYKNNVTEPSKDEQVSLYAVIFKDDQVISITEDTEKYFDSLAYDISNSGIAVGHTTTFVNGSARTKAFYVDTNADDPTMVVTESYFSGASTTARAINNHGQMVGEGEVETHADDSSNPRRREGFIYDIETKKLANLNDLIKKKVDNKCVSDYTIVQARDINDEGVIAATALVKGEKRDLKGEPIIGEDGVAETEDIVRAVILKPTVGGEVCDIEDEEEKVKRNGAGTGLLSVFSLLSLAFIRRFKK